MLNSSNVPRLPKNLNEMENNEKISNKKGNWYIAEIIEKREPVNRNKENDLRRVVTLGNFHLIKAESPKLAYEKAVKIGKEILENIKLKKD